MWGFTFALLIIVIGLWFRWRRKQFSLFKELGIPGPEPNMFFGNLWEMLQKNPLQCHKEWIEKYGKVLGYYFGGTPTLLVADIELMKKVLISDFHKFSNRPQSGRSNPKPKKNDKFAQQLTVLRDKRWKDIRSIITPSFTTSKMRMFYSFRRFLTSKCSMQNFCCMKKFKNMLPIMDNAVDDLLNILDKKAQNGDSFNIYKLYQGLTMDVIGRTAFGIKTNCQNNPDDLILKASRILAAGNSYSYFVLLVMSFPELGSFWKYVNRIRLIFKNAGRNPITDLSDTVENVVKNRRENEQNIRQDLLQIMMDAGISESELSKITDDQLTAHEDETEQQKKSDITNETAPKTSKQLRYMVDKEIVDNAMLFFLAGYETTSTALAWTTHFLINHQDVQEKLREEIKRVVEKVGKLDYDSVQQMQYLDQVFMESLRMYPPVYLFVNREANEDIQYGEYKIKKGISIQIPVYSLHHDPELWEDPEKFDPERFSLENKANRSSLAFQPFGAGPRNCVGMRFAQLEAKLALARILNKYKLLPTENTEREDVELKISLATLTPAKGIHLKAVPLKY